MYSFEEIYQAYLECRKNKRNSINALRFEVNLIDNLWEIYEAINGFKYSPKRYIYFLTSSPKLREVFASDFRDRVVHHLLVKDLEPIFEPIFIYDSYSCRKNRGIHLAIQRLQRATRNKSYPYYLQLDIKSFFVSIDKNTLFEMIRKVVGKREPSKLQRILYLSTKIIFDDPTQNYRFKGKKVYLSQLAPHKSLFGVSKHQGLPIGNLTSQFFANVYLNGLDNYIKRVLKVRYYYRYVDDLVLLGRTKGELQSIKVEIETYLRNHLRLSLRESFRLQKTQSGIDFLGYVTRSTHILVRKRVVNNFKHKKAKFLESAFDDRQTCSLVDAKKFKEINASFYGHIKHADSFGLSKKYQINRWL